MSATWPTALLVIGGLGVLAFLVWTPASKAARKMASDHRQRWTAKEHRAVIKFYFDSRELDPHAFEAALLKLSKELVVTRNSARMALKAVEGLADPGKKPQTATKGLRAAWEDMKSGER